MPVFSFLLATLAVLITYAALRQLYVAIRMRGSALHIIFFLVSMGVLGSVIGNLYLVNADTAAEAASATRIRVIFGGISIALAPWFASFYTGFRPLKFLVAFSVLVLAFVAARVIDPNLLVYSAILDPVHIILPWNERLASFNAHTNRWMYVYNAFSIAGLVYIYLSAVYQYRRGERGRALALLAAVTFVVAAIVHDMVVIMNGMRWILLGDSGWLTMVLLLDVRLTEDIIGAGIVKKSLVESERTLRISEEKYRLLAENVSDVIWTIDMSMKTTYISPSVEKLFGWTPEEWMGLSLDRYFPPESLAKMSQKMREGMARANDAGYDRNTAVVYEVEQIRKDGTRVWTEISARFMWDEAGRPIGGIGVTRDISERKAAEGALLARNLVLTEINRLSIDLASLPSGEEIHRFIARQLMQVAGADAVSLSEYDLPQKQLLVRHIELAPALAAINETAGVVGSLLSVLPVSDESYRAIMSDPVQYRKTMTEVTFGGVPEEISDVIGRVMHIDRFIGVAYIYEGTLYGTSVLAMRQGAPEPPADLLRSFASIAAVSLRRNRAEERLMKSLEEKNILIKEIHHRVKNNLQVIVSLLAMQGDRIGNREARSLHEESIARVHSMALIHESIYRSENFARIDMGLYVNELVKMLLSTYAMDESRVQIRIDVRDVSLNVDRAIPCALLLNELVSNALKHGTAKGDGPGRLGLSFAPAGERLVLVVEDNGPGMDVAVFNAGEQKTLGLQLVKALVRQLGGTVDLVVGGGCRFVIDFPAAG